MAQVPDNNSSLAVLIDADNASATIIEELLAEVARLGIASVKRIYGDWTKPNLSGWKEALLKHSIQPVQQFAYTNGKNATDSAMIIDAMDLLYTGRFSGFCIVSSDSDFTRLASRIRESGLRVYGFGEKKTPEPFRTACDRFIYTEVLKSIEADSPASISAKQNQKELRSDTTLISLIRSAIRASANDDDWAPLSAVGDYISKTANDFDARNYGYNKLSELIDAIGLFSTERRKTHPFIKDERPQ